jgi:hypothetical protein
MEREKYERGDAVFTLLYYPEREAKALLDTAMDVIRKRYGANRINTRVISRVFELLEHTTDDKARLFALLFMTHWETSISNGLEATFDGKGMFKRDEVAHFRAFLIRVGAFIDMTLKFPYNKFNAIEILENFLESTKLEYVMGPLTT